MPRDLRLDLHTHPKPAKRTPFDLCDVVRLTDAARRRGLDGVALTEHAHAVGFWDAAAQVGRAFGAPDGTLDTGGVALYPGMEITLAERIDLVVIAPVDELRRLDAAFGAPLTAGRHPSALEMIEAFDRLALDAVRVLAHPTRRDKPADRAPDPMLAALADAVEINARFAGFDEIAGARGLARRIGRPLVGGSDAHAWPQVGAAWTRVDAQDASFGAVRDAILTGRCRPVVHESAERLVRAGARMKARLKARRPRLAATPAPHPAGAPLAGAGR